MNRKGLASIEIFLMILSIFAFAFILSGATSVSADTSSESSVCCEKTTEGSWCINTDEDSCDADYSSTPTSCETTSYCKLGTCYDSGSGVCMENTPQVVCEEDGGTWDSGDIEDVSQCQLGCCLIEDQASFVTLTRCKELSTLYGIENNYMSDITSEIECIAEASSQDMGACVYESGSERLCDFTTRENCDADDEVITVDENSSSLSSEKTFYLDYLCSAEELATSCAKQASTTCSDNKVYEVDSCGNLENIYSSDKDASWNGGIVTDADDICDPNDGSDVDCGNCDYLLGSTCAEWDGILGIGAPEGSDHYCQSNNCVDETGRSRYDGESWCASDSGAGNGEDRVGSRYFRKICSDGVVEVEACADYRNEICISDGGSFENSGCIVNRWQDCSLQSDNESCIDTDNRDCMLLPPVEGMYIGATNDESSTTYSNPSSDDEDSFSNPTAEDDGDEDSFDNPTSDEDSTITGDVIAPITGFAVSDDEDEDNEPNREDGICVPMYSPGLEFWDNSSASQICGQANAECTVVYEEGLFGGRKVVSGEECLEEDWAISANRVCAALGDCGGYVNYIGTYSDDGYSWIVNGEDEEFSPNAVNIISGGFTGMSILSALSSLFKSSTPAPTKGGALKSVGGWFNVGAHPIIAPILWAGVAYGAGQLIGSMTGMSDENTQALSVAMAAGTGVGTALTTFISNAWVAGGIGIGVGVVVFAVMYKDTDVEIVSFSCMPWQAPSGGDDCEVCNEGDLPCSEYRCKSLGLTCDIVNEGTTQEQCVDVNPNDVTPPVISPWEDALTEGYEYTNIVSSPPGPGFTIENPENSDGCLKAFTQFEFGIETDGPAQCKIDFNQTDSFDDMVTYFGGSNLYSTNHTEVLSLPSASDLTDSGFILENGNEMTLFMRCKDANGNVNEAEYAVNFCIDPSPDTTPPSIEATSVINGGCVAEEQSSIEVNFYTNEPADCKWSTQDQDFDNMPNDMTCTDELYQANALSLFTCESNLTGIDRDGTEFYIRCEDYAGEDETDNNKNAESFVFSLRGSSALTLGDLEPNSTIFGSVSPSPVELYAETSYGCNSGRSICFYGLEDDDNDYTMFFDTDTDDGIHTQELSLPEGEHTYYIKCVDEGGNVVKDSTTFDVEIDDNAPVIARVYEENDLLKIVTVRNSQCAYSLDDCDFAFEEGVEMPYNNTEVHVTDWNEDNTYYIKCQDEFLNVDDDCSVIVTPTQNFL